MSKHISTSILIPVLASVVMLIPIQAEAHCDSLDGPVVQAARVALEEGRIEAILPWVRADSEEEVRSAFFKTLEVRVLGPEAAALADHWFFETVVRIHRAGEGEPYTGLKPAGWGHTPVIRKAEESLRTGSVEDLTGLLLEAAREGLRARFAEVLEAADHAPQDVEAGRRYVAAYVAFLHYSERLHEAISADGHPHRQR